jgi:hypothetical protein
MSCSSVARSARTPSFDHQQGPNSAGETPQSMAEFFGNAEAQPAIASNAVQTIKFRPFHQIAFEQRLLAVDQRQHHLPSSK